MGRYHRRPLGLTHSISSGDYSGSRTFRAANGRDIAAYLQSTGPISLGNSGGPLLNLYGEVVGMNTFHLREVFTDRRRGGCT